MEDDKTDKDEILEKSRQTIASSNRWIWSIKAGAVVLWFLLNQSAGWDVFILFMSTFIFVVMWDEVLSGP